MEEKKYILQLHNHTDSSVLDGLFCVDKWLSKAKLLELPALAITDHGNMGSIFQLIDKAKNYGIKPIAGLEAYLVNDLTFKKHKETKYHITLLAKNDIGLYNLITLNNIAHIEGFYKKPRIDFKHLLKYQEGIIILSGCIRGVIQQAIANEKDAIKVAQFLKNNFDNVYGEIMFLDLDILKEKLTWKTCEICKKVGLPIVITNDCHYLDREDYLLQTILLKIKAKVKIDEKSFKMSTGDLWFKSYDEIYESYNKHYSRNISKQIFSEAVNNTNNIANLVEEYTFDRSYKFPDLDLKNFEDYNEFIDWINK